MTPGMLRISVIIIAFNRKKYLLQAIKSAVNQTLHRSYYEIIVIKNFKDEKIDEYMRSNRVKSLIYDGKDSNADRVPPGSLLLPAIMEASGDVLCFLDDDDYFVQEKLEKVYRIFDRDEKVVYYHNRQIFIDDSGNRIKKRRKGPDYNNSSISVRKEIIDPAKLTKVEYSADTFLYLSALESGEKVVLGKKLLTVVRIHSSRSNPNSKEGFLSWISLLQEQYYRFLEMFSSEEAKRHLKSLIFILDIVLFPTDTTIKPRYFWEFISSKKSGKMGLTLKFLLIFLFGKRVRNIVARRYLRD